MFPIHIQISSQKSFSSQKLIFYWGKSKKKLGKVKNSYFYFVLGEVEFKLLSELKFS